MNDNEILKSVGRMREIGEELKDCHIEGRRRRLILEQHGHLALLLGDEEEGNRLLGKKLVR